LFPNSPFSSVDVLAKQLSSACTVDENVDGKDKNYFAALPTVYDDFNPSTATSLPSPPSKPTITPGTDDDEDTDELMINDPMEGTMIFLEYASEMDALLSDVKKIWERVANDKCTLMYAALYTKCSIDMALFMTRRVVKSLHVDDFQWLVDIHMDILMNFEPVELQDMRCHIKYSQFSKEGAFFEAVMDPGDKFLDNLPSMSPRSKKMMSPKSYIPWQTTRLSKAPVPDAIWDSRDPMVLMHHMMSRYAAADEVRAQQGRAASLMMEDMEHYRRDMLRISKKPSVNSLELLEIGLNDSQMKPLLFGLETLIAHKGSTFTDYNAEFNIWMSFLTESYNSYVWGGTSVATNKNARLQLVQHYKEIATSAKQVIQLSSAEPGGNHHKNLVHFTAEMERLAALPRWDLYSQSPLVNGLAMLEMSFQLMCLGVNLWNEDGMAGFVLHAYNVVMQRKVLKRPIPILEKLCSMLHDAVFMGKRPTHNFRSSLFRFLGAKLEKIRGRNGRENMPPRPAFDGDIGKRHVIGNPKHLPQVWAEDSRIKPENLSKIYEMHAQDYSMQSGFPEDDTGSNSLFGRRWKKQKRSDDDEPVKRVWVPKEERESDHDYEEEDWTMHMGRNMMRMINDNLRGEINKLTDDAFPLARVNAFAVYALLHDILKRMVDKSKADLNTEKDLRDFELMAKMTSRRTAGLAGAMIGAMMDVVDGEGKNRMKMKGRNGKTMILAKDPKIIMNWVAEALIEATEGKDLPVQYMWKHL
jgi:hypothetical protein